MNYLRDLIYRLRAGESERRIAADLGISRPTVAKYHALALGQGYLVADAALPDDAALQLAMGGAPKPPRQPSSVGAVCERWLAYYWPLSASPRFIPQIRGEALDCRKPVAFRRSLTSLIRCYERSGGLARFVLDYRSRTMPDAVRPIAHSALESIRSAIVQGPVVYAGGSLETGRVFRYDASTREILLQAALWRELFLLGHWIQEAVVLRWAELTAEISRRQVRVSEIIELLLATPLPEREVADARDAYRQLAMKECVWTGRDIRNAFEVDHIIPFWLWHNNDLWNLMPALASVNARKSDRLPSHDLVLRRKDCIIYYWEALQAACAERFAFEACKVTGLPALPQGWQACLFHAVSQAVELTAIRRGCERWEP